MASISVPMFSSINISCCVRSCERPQAKFSGRYSATGMRMVGVKAKKNDVTSEMLSEIILEKVKEAEQICEGNETSQECAVAWDEVEEACQAKAHLNMNKPSNDPLEAYCLQHPHADECWIYEVLSTCYQV